MSRCMACERRRDMKEAVMAIFVSLSMSILLLAFCISFIEYLLGGEQFLWYAIISGLGLFGILTLIYLYVGD